MTQVTDQLKDEHLPQLMDLFASAWWTKSRTLADVQAILRGSDLTFAAIDDGNLVGFARVLTDFHYLAIILDVIVAPKARKSGVGGALLETIIGRLGDVKSIELVCQADLIAFYERFGFTDQVGQSRLMRRTSDPALLAGRKSLSIL